MSPQKGRVFVPLFLLCALIVSGCGTGPAEPESTPETEVPVAIVEVGDMTLPPDSLSPDSQSPDLVIIHEPIIATASQHVEFKATVWEEGSGNTTVEIFVNGSLVETCTGLGEDDTCTTTQGPFADREGDSAYYRAVITDDSGESTTRGNYYFAVTDEGYGWQREYLTARFAGWEACKEDLVFHMAQDYGGDLGQLIRDAQDKMYNVYLPQDVIEIPTAFDSFNFYVYRREATANFEKIPRNGDKVKDCGQVDAQVNIDFPQRDDDVILHTTDAGDCTGVSLTHFSAEGHTSKTFLHESGHAIFGLGDEYDRAGDCKGTWYFNTSPEPSPFDEESECRAEQTAKGRNPDRCWQFTSCQTGWWGIHGLHDDTVMIRGMSGDTWGIEARERVNWVFHEYMNLPCLVKAEVILIPLHFIDLDWVLADAGVLVLPCPAPSPVIEGAEGQPFYLVYDTMGEVVHRYTLPLDPRIVLTNPPNDMETMLEEVEFTLRLPLMEGMSRLEFWVPEDDPDAPVLAVDLEDAVERYYEAGGPEQEANCQQPEYEELER